MALSRLLDTTPPRLLPAAACGGLRSDPDHRTRRALLHLSYSCAPQTTQAALVTHGPKRILIQFNVNKASSNTKNSASEPTGLAAANDSKGHEDPFSRQRLTGRCRFN